MPQVEPSATDPIPSKNVVAKLHGIEILSAPHLITPILRRIRKQDYEAPEIESGLANLRAGDRILEMGTGAGIVSAVFAKNVPGIQIQSFEANPELIPHIRELYVHNGVENIAQVINKIVVARQDGPQEIEFYIRSNFLGSRSCPNARKQQII